jgi:hypothetical protein
MRSQTSNGFKPSSRSAALVAALLFRTALASGRFLDSMRRATQSRRSSRGLHRPFSGRRPQSSSRGAGRDDPRKSQIRSPDGSRSSRMTSKPRRAQNATQPIAPGLKVRAPHQVIDERPLLLPQLTALTSAGNRCCSSSPDGASPIDAGRDTGFATRSCRRTRFATNSIRTYHSAATTHSGRWVWTLLKSCLARPAVLRFSSTDCAF